MSITMNKNISFLLLSVALAACILQVAVARPVRRSSQSEEQFRFAIQSPFSGHFVRMLANGSIDTSIDYRPLNTQWFIRFNENGYGFENCAYRGHYLSIASLGSATVLFAQDSSAPLTRSQVERLFEAENLVAEAGNMTIPTVEGEGEGEEEEEELQFSVFSDWVIDTIGSTKIAARAIVGDRNCYLAFNEHGEPASDLCNIDPVLESVVILFKLVFNTPTVA